MVGCVDLVVEYDPPVRIKDHEPRFVATRQLDLVVGVVANQCFIRGERLTACGLGRRG